MNSLVILNIFFVIVIVDREAYCQEIPLCKTVVCPKNEIFSLSASSCQPTCFSDNYHNFTQGCTEQKGCVCREGFIRDPRTYNCIPLKSCPRKSSKTTCPSNEVYSDTEAGCQLTCSIADVANPIKCASHSGCMCRHGFVRDDITGKCVSKQSCSSELIFKFEMFV